MRVPAFVRLLRPEQWVKNSFVLAPLIFSRSFVNTLAVQRATAAALIFCLASSVGYIVNDILDRESDRLHPRKRVRRPIASGEISVNVALVIALLLAIVVIAGAVAMSLKFAGAIALYMAVSISYSAWLKNLPILDLFAVAIGFVLRVWSGAIAISVELSVWMFITTLTLALYLAATKRRQELLSSTESADFRAVLQHYSVKLMDYYCEVAAVGTFVFYSLYIATVRPQLAVTVPVVLFGLFRYRYVMEIAEPHESPTDRLVRDPQILLCAAVWTIISVVVLQRTG